MKKILFIMLLFLGLNTVSAQDLDWETFVSRFKTSQMVDLFEKSNGKVVIESNASSLTITSKGTIKTQFIYDGGVLTLVPANNQAGYVADGYWTSNAIYALSEIKKYDIKQVNDYVENNQLTLEKDGIEMKKKEIVLEDTENSHSSITTVTEFKLDIKNGLRNFNSASTSPTPDKVENPQTGIKDNVGFILLIGIGILAFMNTKKYSKFPQA